MVQKRPFTEEQDTYEVSSKHTRQLEDSDQIVSFLDSPSDDVDHNPRTPGDRDVGSSEIDFQGNFTELPIGDEKGIDNSIFGSVSNSSWGTCSTSEEDVRSEAPFQLLFSPEYYYPNHQIRTVIYSDERYSSLVKFPPRKSVSIGPDFQADIPEWGTQSGNNSSCCSDSAETSSLSLHGSLSHLTQNIDDKNRFSGTYVIPMPELKLSPCVNDEVGQGRIDCLCEDAGSVGCVRQHISDAREKLLKTLGQETFAELGFYDMGEVVAERWNEDEEQLFQEVVFSNPASLGKNFWDNLAGAFPSRTKKEIVSYYFNVFMLRRRAEQNRCDPTSVDSDNDEWRASDDDDDEDGPMEDEDDSVVESPACQDLSGQNLGREGCPYEYDESGHEYDEGGLHKTRYDKGDLDLHGDKVVINISGKSPGKLHDKDNAESTVQPADNVLLDEIRDHDNQDDSCTSCETVTMPQVAGVKVEDSKPSAGTFSDGRGHELGLGHCDTKVWDVGYLSCPKNEVDFLPTCSMIEEVFGNGAWNGNPRDGKGLS